MKRFGFITLAVLTAVFFSSCNDSDGDYASSWAFASAETLSNDYYSCWTTTKPSIRATNRA